MVQKVALTLLSAARPLRLRHPHTLPAFFQPDPPLKNIVKPVPLAAALRHLCGQTLQVKRFL